MFSDSSSVRHVALSQLVDNVRDIANPVDLSADDGYIGLEHISSCTGEHVTVSARDARLKSAKSRFRPGDILYGKLRPNLRKSCVVSVGGVCSTDILVLRLRPGVSCPHWISLNLRGEAIAAQVEHLIGGANLPRIAARDLLQLSIQLPEMDEMVWLEQLANLTVATRSAVRCTLSQTDEVERALLNLKSKSVSREQCA